MYGCIQILHCITEPITQFSWTSVAVTRLQALRDFVQTSIQLKFADIVVLIFKIEGLFYTYPLLPLPPPPPSSPLLPPPTTPTSPSPSCHTHILIVLVSNRSSHPHTHTPHRETGPRCPVDNTRISHHQLFKDNFARREVLSLNVRCSADVCGCVWHGELRDLEVCAPVHVL